MTRRRLTTPGSSEQRSFPQETSELSPNASPEGADSKPGDAEFPDDRSFRRNVKWLWTGIAEWRGWPAVREYSPLVSGTAAWALMIVLAGTGPRLDIWFASQGELKLGATGFCDGSTCTEALFYDAPALTDWWKWFPRWSLSALLFGHGIVAAAAALFATFANLKTGFANCRKISRSDERRQGARAAVSQTYARCMAWTVVACVILGAGLFVWTSQSFAEVENGQIIWYCVPVMLGIWLFTNGLNRNGEDDYEEEEGGQGSPGRNERSIETKW